MSLKIDNENVENQVLDGCANEMAKALVELELQLRLIWGPDIIGALSNLVFNFINDISDWVTGEVSRFNDFRPSAIKMVSPLLFPPQRNPNVLSLMRVQVRDKLVEITKTLDASNATWLNPEIRILWHGFGKFVTESLNLAVEVHGHKMNQAAYKDEQKILAYHAYRTSVTVLHGLKVVFDHQIDGLMEGLERFVKEMQAIAEPEMVKRFQPEDLKQRYSLLKVILRLLEA